MNLILHYDINSVVQVGLVYSFKHSKTGIYVAILGKLHENKGFKKIYWQDKRWAEGFILKITCRGLKHENSPASNQVSLSLSWG